MFVAGFNRDLEVKEEPTIFTPVQDNRMVKYFVSKANNTDYNSFKRNLTSKKFSV